MRVQALQEELLKLSKPEKKSILRRLIADLDQGRDDETGRERLEEARRRYAELKSGAVEAVPAGEAIARARERLENAR